MVTRVAGTRRRSPATGLSPALGKRIPDIGEGTVLGTVSGTVLVTGSGLRSTGRAMAG